MQEWTPEAPLRASELADAEALVREAGWNQTADDWRIFLELGTVAAIRTQAGRVIATAATLPYGGRFGWISMVLVAAEYRRRGLAKRLLDHCIEDLNVQGLVPVLDATPAGREVYRRLGFNDSWTFQRWARGELGDPAPPAGARAGAGNLARKARLLPIDDRLWPQLCRCDATVFGADRSSLLARLRNRAPMIERVAERDGKLIGALLGRDGRIATQIGPLLAEDDEIARALLAQALDAITGPAFIDVPDTKTELISFLASRGFAPQRPLTRMLLGRDAAFDDGKHIYAVAGPEFG